jgi:hypothetical protein
MPGPSSIELTLVIALLLYSTSMYCHNFDLKRKTKIQLVLIAMPFAAAMSFVLAYVVATDDFNIPKEEMGEDIRLKINMVYCGLFLTMFILSSELAHQTYKGKY